MKLFKIKANENLIAIFTYIQSNVYYITLSDLLQFCIDYEYYKELYEHFHIIYQLVREHNQDHLDLPPKVNDNDDLM